MKKLRRLGLSLVVAVALLMAFAIPVGATNPTVSITVTAQVVSITNTQSSWAIGTVTTTTTVYFSATGSQDDDYSCIENTGNSAVDVAIQGANIEGGSYDWTLSATGEQGSETYALNCSASSNSSAYTTVVKPSAYNNIVTNLPATGSDKFYWSMKFVSPTAFNANDDGAQKTTTVTLVATKTP